MNSIGKLMDSVFDDVPQLKRGQVWCFTCGNTFKVNAAKCLSSGWPKCCDQTMSIDSPEERERLSQEQA